MGAISILSCSLVELTKSSGPDPREVQHAKELCEDLLTNVKEQYERFKENPPQQSRGYGAAGYQQGDRQGYGAPGSGYGGYGGQQSPAPASAAIQAPPGTPGAPGAGSPADYSAQYAQYYGGQDPYAAYGGYQAYVAMYQQYYQQQSQSTAPGAPPPGPPNDDPQPPPPPPPPSGSPPAANGGYNNVSNLRFESLRITEVSLNYGDPGSPPSRYVTWEDKRPISSHQYGANRISMMMRFTSYSASIHVFHPGNACRRKQVRFIRALFCDSSSPHAAWNGANKFWTA